MLTSDGRNWTRWHQPGRFLQSAPSSSPSRGGRAKRALRRRPISPISIYPRSTADYLQVGRAKLIRSDLDAAFGAKDRSALTDQEQARLESPFPLSESATVDVPGGAFGRITGTNTVVLQTADGVKKLAFSSRGPEELRAALTKWLGEH